MKKHLLFIGLLFTGSLGFAQQAGPSMFGNNAQHTGVYKNATVNQFENLKWKFETGGRIYASPVIAEGIVYVGSADQNLYAVDVKTGNELWRFSTGGAIYSTPVVFRNTVYFLSFDGHFYALDTKTGQQRWKFATGGEQWVGGYHLWTYGLPDLYKEDLWQYFLSSPVIDDSSNPLIYFGSSDSHLYALDARSGSLQWKFKTGGKIHTSPAYHQGTVFVASWDKKVYAVDAKTGQEKWHFVTKNDSWNWGGMEGILASPTVANGKVLIGARDGFFYALDESTGNEVWAYDAGGTWVMNSAAVKDGVVYFGTSDTFEFIGLDVNTKAEKVKFKASGYLYSSPAIAGNTAYFGSYAGKIYALDLTNGKSWSEFATEGSKAYGSTLYDAWGSLDRPKIFEGYTGDPGYFKDQYFMNRLALAGPVVSSPVVADKVLYVGSADGSLYAINLGKNKAPELKILAPAAGASFKSGTDIKLSVAAEDKDGIAKIEYFASYHDANSWPPQVNLKLGESTDPQLIWQQVPARDYTLTIRVTDQEGGKTVETVNISVKDTLGMEDSPAGNIEGAVVYPNPLQDQSVLQFQLKKAGAAKVSLFSAEGELVAVLLQAELEKGKHSVAIPSLPRHEHFYYCIVEFGAEKKHIKLLK